MITCGRIIMFIAILWMLAGCASESNSSQQITVEDAWVRPGIAGGNSSIYMIIHNRTAQQDTLL